MPKIATEMVVNIIKSRISEEHVRESKEFSHDGCRMKMFLRRKFMLHLSTLRKHMTILIG